MRRRSGRFTERIEGRLFPGWTTVKRVRIFLPGSRTWRVPPPARRNPAADRAWTGHPNWDPCQKTQAFGLTRCPRPCYRFPASRPRAAIGH